MVSKHSEFKDCDPNFCATFGQILDFFFNSGLIYEKLEFWNFHKKVVKVTKLTIIVSQRHFHWMSISTCRIFYQLFKECGVN